jgi:hypothetical protein
MVPSSEGYAESAGHDTVGLWFKSHRIPELPIESR